MLAVKLSVGFEINLKNGFWNSRQQFQDAISQDFW